METPINRFRPLSFGKNKQIKNRVVIPPMASETASQDGFVTLETLEHYQGLVEAGAGLVFVEYTYVHPTGRSEIKQLGISDDEQVFGLSQIAQTIHQSGALAGIQLTHAGGKSERVLSQGRLMSPSAIPVPVKDRVSEQPELMGGEEIQLWKYSFLEASRRALEAGFDFVELHAAHGYGLNQWLSPLTNQRDDEYGRDLAGRSKLLLDIVQRIKKEHPKLLISVRIPGQDFLEGGLKIEDSIQIAKLLERAGVDLLNVSSGIGGWRRPRDRAGEGYLVVDAAKIQVEVNIPVIGVGGIERGEYIDHALRESWFSLAAVGRAILKSPKTWGETQLNQKQESHA